MPAPCRPPRRRSTGTSPAAPAGSRRWSSPRSRRSPTPTGPGRSRSGRSRPVPGSAGPGPPGWTRRRRSGGRSCAASSSSARALREPAVRPPRSAGGRCARLSSSRVADHSVSPCRTKMISPMGTTVGEPDRNRRYERRDWDQRHHGRRGPSRTECGVDPSLWLAFTEAGRVPAARRGAGAVPGRAGRRPARAAGRDRHLPGEVRDPAGRRGPGVRPQAGHRGPPPRVRGAPAGLGVPRPGPGRPDGRPGRHAASRPAARWPWPGWRRRS